MKRANHLFEEICDMENLRRSYLLARRGKRTRLDVVAFSNDLEKNLLQIRQSMLDGTLEFGPYCAFTIHEPKERIIRVAPFVDRVVHHALMRICDPVFEAYQINDSYACRKGKGTYAALERAKAYSLNQTWFLKLDMRKYFDSISHERLKELLLHRFKEKAVLALFNRIIDSHCSDTFPGNDRRGLPIGNLTSQFFANHFLAVADRYAKEELGCRAYLRYMDDIVLWDHDRDRLIKKGMELSAFCESMGLFVKPWCLNRSARGLPLLGYVVHKGLLYLSARAERHYRAKLKTAELLLEEGVLEEENFAAHVVPLAAFRNHARGRWVPGNHIELKPSMGFEPRESRRQLEQQRQELPFSEPQQQQSVEPQQQHRFAGWLRTPSSEVGTDVFTEPDGFGASLWRRIANGVSTFSGGWTDAPFALFLPI